MGARRRKMTMVDVWSEHGYRESDDQFRSYARSVHNLYTLGLRAAPTKIAATCSWLRIFMESADVIDEQIRQEGPTVVAIRTGAFIDVVEPPDSFGFGESVCASADSRVFDLPAEHRPPAILAWLHELMVGAATVRGWSTEPIEFARQFCEERQSRFEIASPTKSSPDRRHKAALTFRIDDLGVSTLTLAIRDRGGSVMAEEQIDAMMDLQDWPSVRNSLQWISTATVGCQRMVVNVDGSPHPHDESVKMPRGPLSPWTLEDLARSQSEP